LHGTHQQADRVGRAPFGARGTAVASVAAAVAILACALWLRGQSLRYLALAAGATVVTLLAAWTITGSRRWFVSSAAAMALLCLLGARAQRQVWLIDNRWQEYQRELAGDGAELMRDQLRTAEADLVRIAGSALDAPDDATLASPPLEALVGSGAEQGVVLYREGLPVAWGGQIRSELDETSGARAAPDSVRSRSDTIVVARRTHFYLTLYARVRRGSRQSIASLIVHADPPADRFASGLAALVARRAGLDGFSYVPIDSSIPAIASADSSGVGVGFPIARPAFRAVPMVAGQAEVRYAVVERAMSRGALLLALALVFFVTAVWRRSRLFTQRALALAVALACVAIVPLSAFSNKSALFDPALYFASFGGPFTANAGALGLTSGLVLLALLSVLRGRVRLRNRPVAVLAVLLIAGLGPFLLRDLARGVTPPPTGVTIPLWLGWQVPLFLAAVSVLLAGVSAGRASLGASRGLSPALGPAFAGIAALLGPIVWTAPARWPGWYPALWILAIASLALTRRTRALVLIAAVVAACGSATLIWGATARKRVELAERDVVALTRSDPDAERLLERFVRDLEADELTPDDAWLLERYVESDLAAAGYPVALATWSAGDSVIAELQPSGRLSPMPTLPALVREARAATTPVQRTVESSEGARLVLAVPREEGHVVTVVVAPRTRLLPEDPYAWLLGLGRTWPADPPYALTLTDVDARARSRDQPMEMRWHRQANELHGDQIVATGAGPRRAHMEVQLRSLDALIQRGTLVVLLDLAIVGILWSLNALAEGGFIRWLRLRRRRWARSYRARLTLALFAFFVIPALVFAAWSYRRLQSEDVQARELLVRETLRSVLAAPPPRRFEATTSPLLLYVDGRLERSSRELYTMLAPVGRFLSPDIHRALDLSEEVAASRHERVGRTTALFGYLAASTERGERGVYAAPAPSNEIALDQRRRDLGILVLFATAVGALAAFWLSEAAAREFARPIGSLRRAALAIARGEREPPLAGEPPVEFGAVFSAFRRMASDLSESREALEVAQRRTAAILRNVASGVIAVSPAETVTLANPRADAMLDCMLPPGTVLADVLPPQMTAIIRAFLPALHEVEEFEMRVGDRQLRGRLTRLAGGAAGAVLTLDDVTDLARAERVLAWGQMARQVAHEIKNPLTPIRLGVQHLQRARADNRVDFDDVLNRNVTRILTEIDRLDAIARSFSRYGTVPSERAPAEPIDVSEAVRDILGLERMGESGIVWERTGADEPVMAMARADELREVLLNLLENARLADARRVDVAVESRPSFVAISVRDDGQGISAEALPRIFEPHFSTRTSGSGLGLAVSRRIVNDWGGDITVASTVGKGTTVTVTLVSAT
jgi:signal transduction histidine kinase